MISSLIDVKYIECFAFALMQNIISLSFLEYFLSYIDYDQANL